MDILSLNALATKLLDKFGTKEIVVHKNIGPFNINLGEHETTIENEEALIAIINDSDFIIKNGVTSNNSLSVAIIKCEKLTKDDQVIVNGFTYSVKFVNKISFKNHNIIYKVVLVHGDE